jgi:glycosyltransferase involved in cell wall biosynthesis
VPAARAKTQLLYNAVSPQRLRLPAGYDRARFRKDAGVPDTAFLIIALGRCVYQKGFDVLLAAFGEVRAEMPQAHLLIAGDGGMLPELAAMIERLQLQRRVRLLGYRADTAALLSAGDLFVLPSRWEGFGLVALEAMALGLPLVVTETSPVTELLRHGETGWIVPCHPSDIAHGILTLYRHATLRQKLACQAAALFERDLTMAAYAQKLGKLLEEVVQD